MAILCLQWLILARSFFPTFPPKILLSSYTKVLTTAKIVREIYWFILLSKRNFLSRKATILVKIFRCTFCRKSLRFPLRHSEHINLSIQLVLETNIWVCFRGSDYLFTFNIRPMFTGHLLLISLKTGIV